MTPLGPIEMLGAQADTAIVRLAPELVPLLSGQLYQSPLKAIEELVVNSYDADAHECVVTVMPIDAPTSVSVLDDGVGMSIEALKSLWYVGRSKKRDPEYLKGVNRKQIGKFGIGKLAAYAIANNISFFTRTSDSIISSSLDFRAFQTGESAVQIPIFSVKKGEADYAKLTARLAAMTSAPASFLEKPTWTMCVLTDLRERVSTIRFGRLRWVLSTAMPMDGDFGISLNGKKVVSTKATQGRIVSITTNDLKDRIEELSKRVGGLKLLEGKLVSDALPTGVTFQAEMFAETLTGGKSEDLGRSHGFFVKVRKRLVNERDELLGLPPQSYKYWSRFHASIDADDLDPQLTASREGVEESAPLKDVRAIAAAIFSECRSKFDAWNTAQERALKTRLEEGRNPVSPRLVEVPVADAINRFGTENSGADADTTWFYLDLKGENPSELSKLLYGPREGVYSYRLEALGENDRLVKFHPREKSFVMNDNHPLVREYAHADRFALRLLQDFVTAEALLEVNLREAGVPLGVIGEILEERDKLIRSLAVDQIYSLRSVATELRDAFDEDNDLEVAVVASARALGFVAKHVGGSDKPDGVARYISSAGDETIITLEAKSSVDVPQLGAIDFSGLGRHMENEGAKGCLLVAPSYPGASRGSDAAAAHSARQQRVSCWTVEQLATVVEAAEAREITARDVLDIVENSFEPDEVTAAVARLLSDPNGQRREVYTDVVAAMETILDRKAGKNMSVDMIWAVVSGKRSIEAKDVARAVTVVSEASRGLVQNRSGDVVVLGSMEEIRRRLGTLIDTPVDPRRRGNFRERE